MNAKLAKEVRATLLADTSMGAHTRRERAEETSVQQAGHLLRAHPWQDADTLSLASHEMLLSIVWRYDLDAPGGAAVRAVMVLRSSGQPVGAVGVRSAAARRFWAAGCTRAEI